MKKLITISGIVVLSFSIYISANAQSSITSSITCNGITDICNVTNGDKASIGWACSSGATSGQVQNNQNSIIWSGLSGIRDTDDLVKDTMYFIECSGAGDLNIGNVFINVIQGPITDITPPQVIFFGVSSSSGGFITLTWDVGDSGGSFLNRVVLERSVFNANNCNSTTQSGCKWTFVSNVSAPTDFNRWNSAIFDQPSPGNYEYRIKLFDNAGNMAIYPTPPPPIMTNISVAPNSGSGASGTFSFKWTDTLGASDIASTYTIFAPNIPSDPNSLANVCRPTWNNSDGVKLWNDAGTGNVGVIAPGTSGTLSNSQCSVTVGPSPVTLSGNDLTLTMQVAFKPTLVGNLKIGMYAANGTGGISYVNGTYQQMGTWTVPGGLPVCTLSVSPNSGSGMTQTFNFNWTNVDLTGGVYVLFSSDPDLSNQANACSIGCQASQCNLYKDNPVDGNIIGTWGSGPPISNSQCSIDEANTILTGTGTTSRTLVIPVTFKPAFAGSLKIGMGANNCWDSNPSTFYQRGTWNVPLPPLPPPPPPPVKSPTLNVNVSTVQAGSSVIVSWTNLDAVSPNPLRTDWIGLYPPGVNDFGYLSYIYAGSCTSTVGSIPNVSGSCSFTIPTSTPGGVYRLQLFDNVPPTNGLARTADFTVTGSLPPPPPPPPSTSSGPTPIASAPPLPPPGPQSFDFIFEIPNPFSGQISTFDDLINAIILFLYYIAGPIIVVMIVLAGLFFLFGRGEPSKIETGKKILFYAIIGLIIILIGRGFITLLHSIISLGTGT